MIDLRPIIFVIGTLLLMVAAIVLVPAAYILLAGTDSATNLHAFLRTSAAAALAGLPMVFAGRNANFQLKPRQLYLLTVASWVIICLFCAIPFVLSDLHMSVVDSLFETVSGITTTGSTVLSKLDALPISILLWRALLQWLGGIGIVVMVIAILPHLRVGGMRLFRSEASDKSEKFTARSRNVAKSIGTVYVGLSVACAFCYWVAGMDGFNALYHAMTTVSTGGFSTSDQSMRQFADPDVIWISAIFMFLSGLPFVLMVQFVRGRSRALFDDQQVRGYAYFVLVAVGSIAAWLIASYGLPLGEALRIAAFSSISIITTTGYVLIDYNLWGGLAVGAFFFMTFTGACAGSTAGGIKIFRFQIGTMMLRNQFNAMLHPGGVFPMMYNGRSVSEEIVTSVIAFSFVFAGTVAVIAAALSLTGLDLTTSLSGAATAIANVGPGLGDIIGPMGNFGSLPDASKCILTLGMLMGRLEILTVMIVFTAAFWRF
ncbi:MAG: TrkH family potassium uptake protein [Gammaproteobacteria bacterium]